MPPSSRVAKEILKYLANNADAQDTVEGIASWWLLDQEVRRRTAEVAEALAELTAEGFVEEQTGRDERIRYRLRADRLEDVRKLVRNS